MAYNYKHLNGGSEGGREYPLHHSFILLLVWFLKGFIVTRTGLKGRLGRQSA